MYKPNEPKTYTVEISVKNRQVKCIVKEDGKVIEPPFKVARKDKIEWTCNFPFAIHFPGITPLGKGRIRSKKEEKPISTKVRNDAQPGCYKYFVAVEENGQIWTDDPEFIVRPPKR